MVVKMKNKKEETEAYMTKDIHKIHKSTTKREKVLLEHLASNSKGDIVEVGCYKGETTARLGVNTEHKVIAIDPHYYNSFDDFRKNVLDLPNIISMRMRSEDAAKYHTGRIGMVFIDGEHTYEAVIKDFFLWHSKLIDGGFIVFHDVFAINQVYSAVWDLLEQFEVLGFCDSILYARKGRDLRKNFLVEEKMWLHKKFGAINPFYQRNNIFNRFKEL